MREKVKQDGKEGWMRNGKSEHRKRAQPTIATGVKLSNDEKKNNNEQIDRIATLKNKSM